MAFRITITDIQRKRVADKAAVEVFGLKDNGQEWKTLLFDNKYSVDHIACFEQAGKDGMVSVEMEKTISKKNGKEYWNVKTVEACGEPSPEPHPTIKAPALVKPEVKVSPAQPVIENDNWRPEALERATDLMMVAARADIIPKKQTGKLLAVTAVEVAKIFEGYLQGKDGVVTATVEALASLNGLPAGTATPPQPAGLRPVSDDEIPF